MKKIFIVMAMFLGVMVVKAESLVTTLNCPTTYTGGSVTCNLTTSSTEGITAMSADVTVSTPASISSITCSNWQGGYVSSTSKIGIYTDTAKTGTISLCTIVLSGTTDITLGLDNVIYSDANYQSISASAVTKSITLSNTTSKEDNTSSTVIDPKTDTTDSDTKTDTTVDTTGTSTDKKTENPSTGDFLPIVFFVVIALLSVGAVYVSIKINKFYKI